MNGLDADLILSGDSPVWMGELPSTWDQVEPQVVVNLCGVTPRGDSARRRVFMLSLLDVLDEAAVPARSSFEAFLSEVHDHAKGQTSYWHCHAGLNRSGLALGAYLHLHKGYAIGEAITQLRMKRSPMVLCNPVFEKALRTWYGRPDEQDFEPVRLDVWLRERNGRSMGP